MTNSRAPTLLFLFLIICFSSHSQWYNILHVGPAFPVDDFFYDGDIGFNIGLEQLYTIENTGFGLFGSFDFNYNSLQSYERKRIENTFSGNGITDADFKFFKYLNMPLSFGVNYKFQKDKKTDFFLKAGVTGNFLKLTNSAIYVNNQTITTEYYIATKFGYRFGGGLLLNDKISVTMNYLSLGKHDIDGIIKYSNGGNATFKGKIKVDMVTLTLGIVI